jgi:hypothetical protein
MEQAQARDRRARLDEWLVHEQFTRRRKEQAENEQRAQSDLGKGHAEQGQGRDEQGQGRDEQGKGHDEQGKGQRQEKPHMLEKRHGVHAKGMDAHAYAKLRMQDLPAVVLQASRLLGCDGEYVVFPRTRNKFLCKINRVIDSFRIGKVLETGAVVTGSFLLHHLMQGAKWRPNDLDLFGTPAALRAAKQLFWGPDVDVSLVEIARMRDWQNLLLLPVFMRTCPWVFDWTAGAIEEARADQVVSYTEWTTLAGFKVKFFCVGGCSVDDVRDTIAQFDLALCRSFFDGRFIYVPRETHAVLQVRRAPMTDTEDKLQLDHVECLLQFARKYDGRGFQIDLPTALCIVASLDRWNANVRFHSNQLLVQQYILPAKDARTWWVRQAERQKRYDEEIVTARRRKATHKEVSRIIHRHCDFVRVLLRADDE